MLLTVVYSCLSPYWAESLLRNGIVIDLSFHNLIDTDYLLTEWVQDNSSVNNINKVTCARHINIRDKFV